MDKAFFIKSQMTLEPEKSIRYKEKHNSVNSAIEIRKETE